ncbi:MAG: hypothetical protein WBF53_13230 [Litorimonas sp.]
MAAFGLGRKKWAGRAPRQVGGNVPPAVAASPRAADLTVGDYANGIPNIKLGEMVRSFFRQMVWVVPLGLVGLVVAWVMTADIKRTYSGEGTIMVQLGDEYVYQPIAGAQGQSSLLQTPDTITLNEVAIMKNPEVMDRVIGEIASQPGGLRLFDEDIAAKMSRHREGTTAYQLAYMEMRKKMDDNFLVAARPKSSIVDLAFKHEDPQFAVATLNSLMDAYMSYRRTVFVEGSSDLIAQRRADTESQLKQNERRTSAFLERQGISNFTSEQAGASKRTEDLRASLNGVRAELVEAERSLASVEDTLRQTPATINLYVDDRASNRIAQAELELSQLLAKYLPTSDPVRQKRTEIEELRRLSASSGGQATGGRRVGPDPVHQDLMRQRNRLQASADSLREKEFTIQRQLNEADAKLRRLTALAPDYNDLVRQHETLTTRLKNYLNKEQEALINQQQAEVSAENVRVISSATYPVKGRNMRMLAFLLASLFWAFTLGMIALFRVFSDPRLYAVPNPVTERVPGLNRYETVDIPEPLQPYQPATPFPAEYAPAAEFTEYPDYGDTYRADAAYAEAAPYNPGAAAFQPATEYDPAAYVAAPADVQDGYGYAEETYYDAYGQPVRPAADGTMPQAMPSQASTGSGPQPYLPTQFPSAAAPAAQNQPAQTAARPAPGASDNPYL